MEKCQVSCQISATPVQLARIQRDFEPSRSRTVLFPSCIGAAGSICALNVVSERKSQNRMFILGMGFVGQFVAQNLKNEGWDVLGSCTSVVKQKELEEKGFDAYLFDANEPELSVLNSIKYCTHLLVSIPPVLSTGDPLLQHGELLRSVLMDGNCQRLCYLSSTSVYGNSGGEWVDEDYPAKPTTESAKMRLVAEEGWLNLSNDLGLSAHILRLGGIYGPGRSVVDTIMKQQPFSESQNMRQFRKYTSRIHVEDIYQALMACMKSPSDRKIYNIVDDDPSPREDVYQFAQNLIEKKWPGRIKKATPSEGGSSFIQKGRSRDEKRVSNARMKNELGVRLLHPSYRSGIVSILDHMDTHLNIVPWASESMQPFSAH